MASPFAVFRKYQAAMLAVFGVLIIIVFTVGEPLSQMVGGGVEQDAVAVRWRGEELTE
ncbi:MAG: hypothetical protein GTO53_03785, partial [Planctomycetales bacterium]|nr:hypothetical protein [Planctomycetales bacterium]NIM08283.1 hypothetical protein [Planctomycetales bacterium]NIN07776.1 hypothetical protein [Planctomycetales bacterium]NIN76896.1 hypothetical protein [Planctomycetales bacterium]NIO34095.1 hypothetical protein [Planctomycetales bacterium]